MLAVLGVLRTGSRAWIGASLSSAGLSVKLFADLIESLLESLGIRFDRVSVIALDSLLKLFKRALYVRKLGLRKLILNIAQRFLGLENKVIGAVLYIDSLLLLLILLGILFGFLYRLIDIFLAHVGRGGYRDMLFLAGALVLSGNIDYSVCVYIEGNFYLRHSSRSRSDTVEAEASERGIALSHLTLTLKDVYLNRSLAVGSGRVDLAFLYRYRGVSFNYLIENSAERFDTKGKRGNVKQKQILDLSSENARLYRRADRDALVRVYTLERLLADKALDGVLNRRYTRGTSDQQNLVYLGNG